MKRFLLVCFALVAISSISSAVETVDNTDQRVSIETEIIAGIDIVQDNYAFQLNPVGVTENIVSLEDSTNNFKLTAVNLKRYCSQEHFLNSFNTLIKNRQDLLDVSWRSGKSDLNNTIGLNLYDGGLVKTPDSSDLL